jgi:hypothetical protein
MGWLPPTRKYHCTVDLLFDWFGISFMTADNFCFYLQNRLIQTSQTGGQRYSDTSPFSIPCNDNQHNHLEDIYRHNKCQASVMLSQLHALYAEWRYAEYRYAECRYAKCHYAECPFAKCHYAECHYAKRRSANSIAQERPSLAT